MAALRNYDQLDQGSPRAWLLTIARNKAIDHFRAQARRPTPLESLPEPAAPTAAEGDPKLWREVAELPEKQRTAVALRFVADLRFREIGEAMGTTEEAARRNVFEGLKRMRGRVDREQHS